MTKQAPDLFIQAYQDCLKNHLQAARNNSAQSRAARKIGRDALEQRCTASDLARIHHRAMANLSTGHDDSNPFKTVALPATLFLIEALGPIERHRKTEQTRLRKAEAALKARERQLEQANAHHDKLLAQCLQQQRYSRNLRHEFLLAQEKERKQISRELHDEIAQVLAGINVRLSALKRAAEIDQGNMAQRIGQTQKLVEQSVEAVHRYALSLRPPLLDDLGLIPSLRSFIKNLPGREGLHLSFAASQEVERLGNVQRTALYRVAQEALTNVIRHAKAKTAHVSIRQTAKQIRLEIRDDGKSFNVQSVMKRAPNAHLGLLGMRERVEMAGGTFLVQSTRGKGTTITADIPLDAATPANET